MIALQRVFLSHADRKVWLLFDFAEHDLWVSSYMQLLLNIVLSNHPSVLAQQFDFLSDRTFFKVDICERILFHQPYEVCENSNTYIEELFSQP